MSARKPRMKFGVGRSIPRARTVSPAMAYAHDAKTYFVCHFIFSRQVGLPSLYPNHNRTLFSWLGRTPHVMSFM